MTLNHITIWHALVVAFALTAAAGDIRWRKIPRAFTTSGLLAGLLYHAMYGGLVSALAAALLGFAVGLAFFQFGAVGGGDVKLIVALGGMLELNPWLYAMEVAVLVAGTMAFVQAARRGMLRQTLSNIGQTFRWMAHSGVKEHPVINVKNAAMLRAPFGVAAALGVLFALVKP